MTVTAVCGVSSGKAAKLAVEPAAVEQTYAAAGAQSAPRLVRGVRPI
jgi:hypothetical protein